MSASLPPRTYEDPSIARYREVREQMSTPLPSRYNIAAAVCDRWAQGDGRAAMLVPEARSVRTYTFDHFAQASARLANGLAALGVRRGDRVAICLPQSPDCATAHLAVQRLGAIAVPISILCGTEAVRHRLVDSRARVLIAAWDTQAWIVEHELAQAVTCVMAGSGVPHGVPSLDDLIARAAPSCPPVASALHDAAILIYTSGTSGPAKGALHAQRVVPAHTEPISLAHNLLGQDGDVLWSPADWAWGGGLIDCLFASWQAGRPIVAWRPRGFDPDAVIDLIERCAVTNTFLPPTALKRLRDASGLEQRARRLPLRSIMTGGERCGEELIEWSRNVFDLTPNEVYGQTEVSAVLGNSSTLLPVKPGSVGMEYPRARAAVLDDAGAPVPVGESGEIALHASTPAMFLGYWSAELAAPRSPFAAPDAPTESGSEWHRTGDLGRIDADGYFWHDGRRDDVILSSGYRIGPAEVEEILAQHPGVGAAVVIGEPDAQRGQLVSAVLELRPGVRADPALEYRLKDMVSSQLAAYEVPRRIHFVDTMPRTESGKVRRGELRERFARAAATRE
jgi:acetyl-CoA synthetase